MKILSAFLVFLFCSINLTVGQTWETVGAGVAEFLLSSPTTANKMNEDHQIALSIIGRLLETASQRKHEINVAEASKTEINLNTNSGQLIQLVMDSNGNLYALNNGVIFPISKSIVDQAEEFILNQQPGYMAVIGEKSSVTNPLVLPHYNIAELERSWNKSKSYSLHTMKLYKYPVFLTDYMEEFGVTIEDFYLYYKKDFVPIVELNDFKIKNFVEKNLPIATKDRGLEYAALTGFSVGGYLHVKLVEPFDRGTFLAKWVNDLNANGNYEFTEFQDLRRIFFTNESFLIISGFYFHYPITMKLMILNQLSGIIVYQDLVKNLDNKTDYNLFSFGSNFFEPGIYIYHLSIINSKTNEEIKTISDNFQILSTRQADRVSGSDLIQGTDASPKEKMINELIQLLREGRISEETFNRSMKALEEKEK